MPLDPNDPADLALIQAEVTKAVKPLQAAIVEANANIGKLTARAEVAETNATKAADALKAATESGTATTSELVALRERVAAADKAAAEAAKAALDARLAKLPEAVRAMAPQGDALAAWLDIAEKVPTVPAVSVGGGGGGGPTQEDIDYAIKHGFSGATPENVIKLSEASGPRAQARRAATGK